MSSIHTTPPPPPAGGPFPPAPPTRNGAVFAAVVAAVVAVCALVALAVAPGNIAPDTATTSSTATTAALTTTTRFRPVPDRVTTTTIPTNDPDLFWQAVHAEVPYLQRSTAVEIARSTCNLIDAAGVQQAMRITTANVRDSGVNAGDVGYVIGAGIPTYCPEHLQAFRAWLAANS